MDFPETVNNTNERAHNLSKIVDAYREAEIQRQLELAETITLDCERALLALQTEADISKAQAEAANDNFTDTYSLMDLRDAVDDLKKKIQESRMARFVQALKDFEVKLDAMVSIVRAIKRIADVLLDICDGITFGSCPSLPGLPSLPPFPWPGQLPSIEFPSIPSPAIVLETKAEESEVDEELSFWGADVGDVPTVSLDPPSFTLDLNLNTAWLAAVSVLVVLDIFFLVAKGFKVIGATAEAAQGSEDRRELEEPVFDSAQRPLNDTDPASEKREKAVSTVIKVNTKLQFLGKKWPVLLFVCQYILLVAIVASLVAAFVIGVWTLFQDDLLDAVGFTQGITIPVTLNVLISNNQIISSAFGINSKALAQLEKSSRTRIRLVDVDVKLFNAKESTRIDAHLAEYNALMAAQREIELDPLYTGPYTATADIAFQPRKAEIASVQISSFQCQIDPGVDARVFTDYNATKFQKEVSDAFVPHVVALRDFFLKTLYMIGVVIGFYLLSFVLGTAVWAILKKFGAVRENHVAWFRELPSERTGKMTEMDFTAREYELLKKYGKYFFPRRIVVC
jgi:hypothetical protein